MDIQHSVWEATPLITTKVKVTPTHKKSEEKLEKNAKSGKGGKRLKTLELKLN
jgi:hypothetical protein